MKKKANASHKLLLDKWQISKITNPIHVRGRAGSFVVDTGSLPSETYPTHPTYPSDHI